MVSDEFCCRHRVLTFYTYSNTTVVERYEAFVNLDQKADALRASRNENAKKMKGKMEKEVRDALIAEGKRIKD